MDIEINPQEKLNPSIENGREYYSRHVIRVLPWKSGAKTFDKMYLVLKRQADPEQDRGFQVTHWMPFDDKHLEKREFPKRLRESAAVQEAEQWAKQLRES